MLPRILLALALVHGVAAAQQTSDSLDAKVKTRIAGFKGQVSLFAKNLDSGVTYEIRGDEPVRTASTIKLPIMAACFAMAKDGQLNLSEPLKLTAEEKVSGSGILQDLSPGDQLPVRDMIDLMIVLSDNTATNLILNRVGANAVNERLAAFGLTQTRSMRKILGDRNDLKPFPSGISREGAKPDRKSVV